MSNTDGDIVFLTIKLTRKLRVEFKAAARVDEMDVSNALRQFMNQTVRSVKEREPQRFKIELDNIRNSDKEEDLLKTDKPKTRLRLPVTSPVTTIGPEPERNKKKR